ncbi:MAG: 7-cyano-7-deazaguanine synthase QueC [Armatimonadetes bacterium]|nr:7-cyano-7-deazaguanine synthase QueC [Armatimonadota bacterium]
MAPVPKAVVLLSGGLDSATCLAIAQSQGFACFCMSFDYGQRHRIELQSAKQTAESQSATEHRVVKIDASAFTGSALTEDIDVPKSETDGIPVTYVPARNTVFLSFALAWAEALGSQDIFIGVNALDYSGYPDCRPEYISAYERMANLATKAAVEGRLMTIHTPLIDKTKAQTIEIGSGLGVDYGLTSSCYDPDAEGKPCGECDSCRIRNRGFEELGMEDPLLAR